MIKQQHRTLPRSVKFRQRLFFYCARYCRKIHYSSGSVLKCTEDFPSKSETRGSLWEKWIVQPTALAFLTGEHLTQTLPSDPAGRCTSSKATSLKIYYLVGQLPARGYREDCFKHVKGSSKQFFGYLELGVAPQTSGNLSEGPFTSWKEPSWVELFLL